MNCLSLAFIQFFLLWKRSKHRPRDVIKQIRGPEGRMEKTVSCSYGLIFLKVRFTLFIQRMFLIGVTKPDSLSPVHRCQFELGREDFACVSAGHFSLPPRWVTKNIHFALQRIFAQMDLFSPKRITCLRQTPLANKSSILQIF